MKKWMVVLMLMVFCTATVCIAAGNNADSYGPAPNSGDGDPDGSGLDPVDDEPNDGANNDTGNGGIGPAPSSGDGISDGSGLDSPNGPNG